LSIQIIRDTPSGAGGGHMIFALNFRAKINTLGQCFSTWVPRNPEVPPIPLWVP